MKISAKADYACRALMELSLHWPDTKVRQVADIGRRQKIPDKFLVHILIELKGLGYVDSTRGKSGGYYLTAAPDKIKLKDIIRHFGGVESGKKTGTQDVLALIWKDIDAAVLKALENITFETICNRHRTHGKAITYDI